MKLAGARIVVARSHDAIAKLAADLGGDAYPTDLADATAIDPLVRAIEADGPIDVLVNNAAGALTVEDPRHLELTREMVIRSVKALESLDAFHLPL